MLSKRPEMHLPDLWPAYYEKAKGCEIWDLDGNKYIDMSYMGIGSCILGYADSIVDNAVKRAVDKGSMATLNCPEEVELAQVLCRIHPWAEMVRYARTGGEAMAIAIRIARAYSKKDVVLFCGYHGWHDWYLAANLASGRALDGHLIPGLSPSGVPRCLRGTSFPFEYNDTKGFLSLLEKHGKRVGAIIMEPVRNQDPAKDFLDAVRTCADKYKAVLVVDEITAGFRFSKGGAHLLFGLTPDISVFAKGMSNGYPMAAIIGKRNVMNAAQETFVSSAYWTERIGPVAAISTINKLMQKDAPGYLARIGEKIQYGWQKSAMRHGIDIEISGMPALLHFSFSHKNPLALKTLFTQLMLEKGFLASTAFYASCAHKEKHVDAYLESLDKAFAFISKALMESNPEKYLNGPVCHSGFKRLA